NQCFRLYSYTLRQVMTPCLLYKYGGYVALTAAWQTPEKFQCAASFAGISDLPALVKKQRLFDFGEISIARIAKSLEDFDSIQNMSAIFHIDKIKIPLLLAHGDEDRVIPIQQSRALAEQMQNHQTAYEYIEQAGGDHYLSLESHRIVFFEALGRFLKGYLQHQ
ncbi:MAG: prolyl oligopeptidase family serine peptidase, partial [Pseudomonadota bacterium]